MAVLTCMDARLDPLAILGLEVGDAVVIRNGGARFSDDVHGALVVGRHLLGVERLLVVGHTDCRMTAPSPAAVHEAIAEAGGPDTVGLEFATAPDPASGVRDTVDRVTRSPYLEGLAVEGFVYDLAARRLTPFSPPGPGG